MTRKHYIHARMGMLRTLSYGTLEKPVMMRTGRNMQRKEGAESGEEV